MQHTSFALAFALTAASLGPAQAADGSEADRQQRWQELSRSVFGDVALKTDDSAIRLEAPKRAEDAALVPMTIRAAAGITETALIIDDNPSPVAARISFGPAGDPRQMRLRVRIDGYTNVHAVTKSPDGELAQTMSFVKASGGCSAPAGASDAEAMRGMGEMRMRFAASAEMGGAPEAILMIRHPNFNGMQMNQETRGYTPARYINAVEVSRGGERVFAMESDISLSTNPVISFLYKPDGNEPLHAKVTDTDGTVWTQSFTPDQVTN
ncbi:quinoprotein dehydrogenase-associated SoxYZ-like carrier [Terrihabitans sp. B22-R8]|uniref:quinoprotein dehydrogenase-associated SoxYZ-like carrier n=1 Tax=Terrihabitans sp. B22-R8 TaxID=3425128 RepID=UPI00403D17EC